MQFTSSPSIALFSENLPEDDIDRLYRQLGKLEPPADSVQQILARIKQLPANLRHFSAPPHTRGDIPEEPPETSGSSR